MADDRLPEDDDLDEIANLGNERPDFSDPGLDTGDIEIENESSMVSSTPTKNLLIIGILVIASVVFLYNVVFKEDEETKKKNELEKITASQPVDEAKPATKKDDRPEDNIGAVTTPELQEIEGLQPLSPPDIFSDDKIAFPDYVEEKEEPKKPAEAPKQEEVTRQPIEPVTNEVKAIEPVTQPEAPKQEPAKEAEKEPEVVNVAVPGPSAAELAARKAARRKSGMLSLDGGGTPDEKEAGSEEVFKNPVDISHTSANQVVATAIGNTDFMIAQGKMIDAVLETAINTNLPGSLRAVVSRDVYAETGKSILIPKGSRLIGTYNNNIESGQTRVVVSWDRVIRPDGVDVAISSPGTDQLGRSGVTGLVDKKYFEILSNALLLSAITVGGTMALDSIQGSQGTSSSTTTNTDGSSTSSQTGTPTDFAILDSVSNIGDVAGNIASDMLDDRVTIYVHQGSKIKVFVNRDLIFPESSADSVLFLN